MGERFPQTPTESSLDEKARQVDDALDAVQSRIPPSRFSKLRRWIGALMGATAVAGIAPEAVAEKFTDMQARVSKAASAREFDFDSAEERANEKAKAEALEHHHAKLLEMNRKPQIDKDAVMGTVNIDRRVAKHGMLGQLTAKDPRESIRGHLTDIIGKPIYFAETMATSSIGEDDVDGYVHDVASVRNYYPARVGKEAKTSPLSIAVNAGKEDPRTSKIAHEAELLNRLGDALLDGALVRSSDLNTIPADGKIVALDSKTKSAVLEAEKNKPKHRVVVEHFKTVQPMQFTVEKRGESFWLVGVRYDMQPK